MPTPYFTIHFYASIFSSTNAAKANVPAAVQYFSTQQNSWLSITKSSTDTSGTFKDDFELPMSISKNDEITRSLKDMISSGGIPSFRLILDEKNESEKSYLLSNLYTIDVIDEEQTIKINFGKNWLLNKEDYIAIAPNTYLICSKIFDNQEELENCLEEKEVLRNQNNQISVSLEELEKERDQIEVKKNMLEKEKQKVEQLNENLNAEILKNKESINSLSNSLKTCEGEKLKHETRIETLLQEINEISSQLATCKEKDYSQLEEKYKKLEKDAQKCTEEKEKLALEIESKTDRIEQLIKEKEACEDLKTALKTELEETKTELIDYKNKLKECESTDCDQLKKDYEQLKEEKDQLETNIEICNQNNQGLNDKIEALEDELKEIATYNESENPNNVEARDVYTGIAKEVKEAQLALVGSNMKLGNIKLNLKALVNKSPTGLSYNLLDTDAAMAIHEGAISTIEMDVLTNEDVTPPNSETNLPNLIGLTETAVRKRLNAFGLKLKPVYTTEGNEERTIGQSYKQIPESNTPVSSDQIVTVFFAKNKTS